MKTYKLMLPLLASVMIISCDSNDNMTANQSNGAAVVSDMDKDNYNTDINQTNEALAYTIDENYRFYPTRPADLEMKNDNDEIDTEVKESSSTTAATSTRKKNIAPSSENKTDEKDQKGNNKGYSAVSVSSTTYYRPDKRKRPNRADALVGTWKNDELTIHLYQSGLAKEIINNEGSTPQKSYRSWSVKGKDKELCLITSKDGVENCYDMLIINQEQLQLNMYDQKIVLDKQ